jgi:hypothetical protein
VVHLEDEAGEATLMTATAVMLWVETTSDSAARPSACLSMLLPTKSSAKVCYVFHITFQL